MNNKHHKDKTIQHTHDHYSYIYSLVHNSITRILPAYLIDEISHKVTSNLLNHDISVKK